MLQEIIVWHSSACSLNRCLDNGLARTARGRHVILVSIHHVGQALCHDKGATATLDRIQRAALHALQPDRFASPGYRHMVTGF